MTTTERIMTTTERIQALVREFIQHSSGGEKYLSILTHVVDRLRLFQEIQVTPDEVETAIRSMPDMRVLTYGWDMGGTWREKMFVYTPLPNSTCPHE